MPRLGVHRPALTNGIVADDAVLALAHALVVTDLDDDDSPARFLVPGPDRAGNILVHVERDRYNATVPLN